MAEEGTLRPRIQRVVRNIVVECSTDHAFAARLVDISKTGCALLSNESPEISQAITVTILLSGDAGLMALEEERAVTGMASIFARGKARAERRSVHGLAVRCLNLPGQVVRQERRGEKFVVGVAFRWLPRSQVQLLDEYLSTALVSEEARVHASPEVLSLFPARHRGTTMPQPVGRQSMVGQPMGSQPMVGAMAQSESAGDSHSAQAAAAPVDTAAASVQAPAVTLATESRSAESRSAETDLPTQPARDVGPLSVEEAREAMASCDDRDEAFILLLRAMRRRASQGILFAIRHDRAEGYLRLDVSGLDERAIKTTALAVDSQSSFAQVMRSQSFFVGPLFADDPTLRSAFSALCGGELLPSALLIPIVIRDRVVAIAMAHSPDKSFPIARVTELLAIADMSADAACRYLVKQRGEQEPAQVSLQPGQSSSRRKPPKAEMVELFARLESGAPELFESAVLDAKNALPETLSHLERHFPGKLTMPRSQSSREQLASKRGPVLELMCKLGDAAAPVVSFHMGEASAELRYYAVACAFEIRSEALLPSLTERVFDDDEGIRELAIRALRNYGDAGRAQSCDLLRKQLQPSNDPEHLEMASNAIVVLGCQQAVPDLIDLLAELEDAAFAQRGLIELTGADFASEPKKWRRWWHKNKSKDRVDWLIEALGHARSEIRVQAAANLRALTKHTELLYDPFGSKHERSLAQSKWRAWRASQSNTRDS